MRAAVKLFSGYIKDLVLLAFPDNCLVCNMPMVAPEHDVCFSCLDALPETGFHKIEINPVAQQFWGRLPIEHAAAWLYVRDANITQKMIHMLKYRKKKSIGILLGHKYGKLLSEENNLFNKFDLIVPVPLHPVRLKQRGYNQCDYFAKGLSQSLNIPFDPGVLIRVRENISQTKKNRYERWQNVDGIFELAKPEKAAGKHILLVDDVVTTGATLESCAAALLKAGDVTISIAAIATAAR